MEWTIQQIVAVAVGIAAVAIIMYFAISTMYATGAPPPPIKQQVLPLLIPLLPATFKRRRG